mmetsp:Transcript_34116/g.25181  ORF Transcript_34116/g.25181 Transcript_34116/m.25181 type:complete len:110 (-) Transcript_34116:1611-1940(-)
MMMPYFTAGPVQLYSGHKPLYRPFTDGSWGGDSYIFQTKVIGFSFNKTYCGMKQRFLTANEYGSDLYPPAIIYQPTFYNMVDDALYYFPPTPPEWASLDKCGNFPCTGL